MNRVTTFLIALLFAASASTSDAQNAPAAPAATSATTSLSGDLAPASCGPASESFHVVIDKTRQPNPTPVPTKAVVYFVQDDRFASSHRSYPIVKWAVDGSWLGATRHKALFHAALDPGDYRLCAAWQTSPKISKALIYGTAHLHAEAGRIYYFRAQNLYSPHSAMAVLSLLPVSAEEGVTLYSQSGASVFTPKN